MTTILFVDDLGDNFELFVSVLESHEYEVRRARNGVEALEMARAARPDVIVSDIFMPIMDGYELCRQWKADEQLYEIPFIFYTSTFVEPRDQQFGLSLGAERFVLKPQKADSLVKLLQEVLEEARRKPPSAVEKPLGEEMEVLRQYNEVLFRKLERKVAQLQAEIAARRETEEFNRRIIASSDDAIAVLELDGILTSLSEGGQRLLEIDDLSDCLGKSWLDLWQGGDRLAALRAFTSAKDGGKGSFCGQCETAKGRPRWWEVVLSPIRDASGRIGRLLAVSRDITGRRQAEQEREKLEEQLRMSQKMEAVGRLAGSVAHDFNNTLTVINALADIAIAGVPEGNPLRDDLLEIRKAGVRAAFLTRQLLTFSREQVLRPTVLDFNRLVSDLQKMFVGLLGDGIEFRTALARNLGHCLADAEQLEQVLLNLIVNARDAMPGGGRLLVETANVEIDARHPGGQDGLRPGPYVMLAVTDTGVGMDEATRARVFEPFFTTKPKDKGTGFGLATAYGIIKQSHGHIAVTSEPGKGATFRIYLPRVGPEASSAAVSRP